MTKTFPSPWMRQTEQSSYLCFFINLFWDSLLIQGGAWHFALIFPDSLTQSGNFRREQWIPVKVGKEQKIFGANFMQKTFFWVDSRPKISPVAAFTSFKYAAEEDRTSSRFVLHISIWICRHSKGTWEPLRSVCGSWKCQQPKDKWHLNAQVLDPGGL